MIQLLCITALLQLQQTPSNLSPEKWCIRAEAEFQAKNWVDLNSTGMAFTREYPNNGKAWGYLALSLMGLGQAAEAELALEKGTKTEPAFQGNWYNLGFIRAQLKRPRETVAQCLDELVKLSPEAAIQFSRDIRISEILIPSKETILDLGKLEFRNYPAKKLNKYPPYPIDARNRGIQGTVWVELVVDSTGRTVSAGPAEGPSELIHTALVCAIQARFPPLIRDGSAKAYKISYGIPFKLR